MCRYKLKRSRIVEARPSEKLLSIGSTLRRAMSALGVLDTDAITLPSVMLAM